MRGRVALPLEDGSARALVRVDQDAVLVDARLVRSTAGATGHHTSGPEDCVLADGFWRVVIRMRRTVSSPACAV
eukprot:4411042-Prymnesium_polylepis.2